MNTKLMVSVLRGAANGSELLKRLDALTEPLEAPGPASAITYGKAQPTIDPIAF